MTVGADVESLRAETAAGFARIEGKLDAYIISHVATHATEQATFYQHKLDLAPGLHDLAGPPTLANRTRALEDASLAQQTVLRTLKAFLVVATGGSLLSALGFAITVWKAVTP